MYVIYNSSSRDPWLASPSAKGTNWGNIVDSYYKVLASRDVDSGCGVRPVVSLPVGVNIELKN